MCAWRTVILHRLLEFFRLGRIAHRVREPVTPTRLDAYPHRSRWLLLSSLREQRGDARGSSLRLKTKEGGAVSGEEARRRAGGAR